MPMTEVTLRFLAAPTDADGSGLVPAGRVMEWIDNAGYACAVDWSSSYCVTAYVGNISFSRPIHVGDLVEARASLVHTGRSSMSILVTVSSGDPRSRTRTVTTDCLMIFVAVDEGGNPRPVPSWVPDDVASSDLQRDVLRLTEIRRAIEEAMAGQTYSTAGTAPSVTLRFLAAPNDVNWGGKVHGGVVMRWIDEAARVVATRWTGAGSNNAVYTGGVRFYTPLRIGDVVEVRGRLLHTGRSSMHISVHVFSGDPASREPLHLTTHCLTIFVCVDPGGRAREVPTWTPASEEDLALQAHAGVCCTDR